MRWFRHKTQEAPSPEVVSDGMTPGPYSAYWWRPGCTCHWSAGIDADYCDFCKAERRTSPTEEAAADHNADFAHVMLTHTNGDQCIWLGPEVGWFVPYDVGGEGDGCPHDHDFDLRISLAQRTPKVDR